MKSVARLTFIIVATVLFLLLGCLSDNQIPLSAMANSLDNVTATDLDNGGKVQIKVGGILTLRLEAIPGTGYSWEVVQNNLNLLKPLGESKFEETESGKLGAVEYQIFHFRALAPGTNILKLHYVRKWEKEAIPIKIYSITVQIIY